MRERVAGSRRERNRGEEERREGRRGRERERGSGKVPLAGFPQEIL